MKENKTMTKKYKWKDNLEKQLFLNIVKLINLRIECGFNLMTEQKQKEFIEFKEFLDEMESETSFEIDHETNNFAIKTFYEKFEEDIVEIKGKN